MTAQIQHLSDLYKQKRFSKIKNISTNKMLKVDSEEVTQVIKKNHSYLVCTCESSGKTGHNSLCRHKQFFITYPLFERFDKKVNEILQFVEVGIQLKREFKLSEIKTLLEEMR